MFGLNLLHLATFDPQQARSGHRFLAGFGIRTAGQEGPSIALLWLVARRFAPKFLLHALVGSGSASIGGYDAGARPGQHQLRHLLVQGKRSLTPPGSPHRGALPGPLMAKATMGRLKCCPLGSNAINLEARGLDTNLAAVRGGDGGQENDNSPRQRQQPRADGCGRQAARTAVRSEKTRCVDFHRRKEKLKRPRIGSRGGGCGRRAAFRCLNNRTSLLCSDHSIGANSIYTLLNHNQSDLREGDTFFTFI